MKAVVVADGAPVEADAAELSDAGLVVAADAGATWLRRVGRRPDVLVGDLDSIDPALVDELAAAGTGIERHPVDKDASDTELAVERAVASNADEIVVLGALGGPRLDHELANLLLLADPAWHGHGVVVRIVRGTTAVRALHGPGELGLAGRVGDTVTLIPIGGDVEEVRTTGLRFALDGEALRIGRSRGLSNVVSRVPASVEIGRGTLLVVETQAEEKEQR